MTTNNHPANGPVSLDRLHQISEILSKAAAQSDGGNLGYAMADAVKVIDEVLSIPAALPCPVHLEPGLKFGKGVRTQCMLDALRRRSGYYAELEAMTPEQRVEHDAGISEFKAMLGTPAPVVPDEKPMPKASNMFAIDAVAAIAEARGWNTCRVAMLQGKAEPVTTAYKSPDDFICMLTGRAKYLREKGEIKSPELLERAAAALQGENADTPVIPNGWKLVPIDPTKDMLRAGQSVVGFWLNTVHCYSKMLAAAPAAPQQEVK
ncbi:hypothetical protein HV079_18130 [Citrobacter freundii]|uniref:hypothetical protein n=1 Tax=Citrobacter freundii TaxID=546 RepID=UPI0015E9F359|nr:hypothetical protein [Citrobacter freundii]QLZ57633.1 hypothetical protein HV079_18130 [Citrobacter freundii]